jgi:hypothetical protein
MIFGIRKGPRALSGEHIDGLVTRLGKGKRSKAWYWFKYFERPWADLSNEDLVHRLRNDEEEVVEQYVSRLLGLIEAVEVISVSS